MEPRKAFSRRPWDRSGLIRFRLVKDDGQPANEKFATKRAVLVELARMAREDMGKRRLYLMEAEISEFRRKQMEEAQQPVGKKKKDGKKKKGR